MLILSQSSKIFVSLVLAAMLSMVLMPIPKSQALEFTTESQLVDRLSNQLGSSSTSLSGPKVLGATTAIPFFPRGFVYPIAELGNCNSKAACFAYCEDAANTEICAMVSFRNGMMTADQLKQSLTLVSYIKSGYFANCNNINSCAKLCDLENAQQECTLLAQNMQSGSQVLGAQDSNPDYAQLDSILQKCSSMEDCNTATNSNMYASLGSANGALSGLYSGRVLGVSSDPSVLDNPIDTPTEVPPPYEPTNYLNCVVSQQSSIPEIGTPTEQFNSLNSVTDSCGEQFSPADGVASFSDTGSEQVSDNIADIQDCILSLTSSREISQCLR